MTLGHPSSPRLLLPGSWSRWRPPSQAPGLSLPSPSLPPLDPSISIQSVLMSDKELRLRLGQDRILL